MKRKKGKRYIFLAERREGKEGEKGKKKGGDTHLVSCKSLRYVRFFLKKSELSCPNGQDFLYEAIRVKLIKRLKYLPFSV